MPRSNLVSPGLFCGQGRGESARGGDSSPKTGTQGWSCKSLAGHVPLSPWPERFVRLSIFLKSGETTTVSIFFSQTERINSPFLKVVTPWRVERTVVSGGSVLWTFYDQVELAPSPVSDTGQVWLGKSRRTGQTQGDPPTQLQQPPAGISNGKTWVFQYKNSSLVFLWLIRSSCFSSSDKLK